MAKSFIETDGNDKVSGKFVSAALMASYRLTVADLKSSSPEDTPISIAEGAAPEAGFTKQESETVLRKVSRPRRKASS